MEGLRGKNTWINFCSHYLPTCVPLAQHKIKLILILFTESDKSSVPSNWAPMAATENLQIVPLIPRSTEFNQVQTTFRAGGYQPTIVMVNIVRYSRMAYFIIISQVCLAFSLFLEVLYHWRERKEWWKRLFEIVVTVFQSFSNYVILQNTSLT